MRLKNYGPGELSDRLSILALKRLFGGEAGKDCTVFNQEWAVLLTEIRSRTLNGKWFEAVLELAAVNAALWHAEDDLRVLRQEEESVSLLADAGRLAFRIQSLNDQRSALIDRINRDAGEGGPSDKVFREGPASSPKTEPAQ
jgi:hypothetical protein